MNKYYVSCDRPVDCGIAIFYILFLATISGHNVIGTLLIANSNVYASMVGCIR